MGGKDKGFELFFRSILKAFLILSMIRPVQLTDAASLLDIYRPFILNSGVTQETEVPSVDEFTNRIEQTIAERPWLVAELNGRLAGYAYAGKHRERKGYQWCVESSVYLHADFFGKNIAAALYNALLDLLTLQGYVNVYAVITLPNVNSVSFHEKFVFRYLTTYKKIGYKLNKWHDVGWWEYQINAYDANTLIPFPALNDETVDVICRNASAFINC